MNLITQHGSEHQKRVAAFMRGAGQAVPDTVTMPDVETRRLRARLILEEALETIEALGCAVRVGNYAVTMKTSWITDVGDHDAIGIIDGCCDLSVVLQGTLAACGLPDTPFIEEASGDAYKMVVKGRASDDQYQTLVRAGDELWEITVRRAIKAKEDATT